MSLGPEYRDRSSVQKRRPMRALWIAIAAVSCAVALPVRADQTIASLQQTLKDQGFYYGEISGTKDADTTAAIRRYQIRNGLKITGDLNAETQKSLGLRGSAPATAPSPLQRPRSAPPTDDTSDLRDNVPTAPRAPDAPVVPPAPGSAPRSGYAPAPGAYPTTGGVFDGTPYQLASAPVQRQVIIGAQFRLARQGYYRSTVDGVYGEGTAFALRAFQSRFGLPPTGRLDMQTLAALGLLPGQRGPGMEPPRRRIYRAPGLPPRPDERIFVPR